MARRPGGARFNSLRIPGGASTYSVIPIQTFRTYQCHRHKSTTLSGRRVLFTFSDGDTVKFSAKFKKKQKLNYIPIVTGSDPHLSSENCAGFLLYGNDFSDFSLRKGSQFGDEILSLQFRRPMPDIESPRKLFCYFYHQPIGCPDKLESADPRSQGNFWIIDLGAETCISSVKNCRLDYRGTPYCYVRKMEAEMIEVEAKRNIDELCLFAIAIGSMVTAV
jgi:hypothetical protein